MGRQTRIRLNVLTAAMSMSRSAIQTVSSRSGCLQPSVTPPKPAASRGIYDRITRGARIFLATPRLRGLLAINMAAAAAGTLVIVNTVVYVQHGFGLGQGETALALAAFGGGSMLVALALPRLLDSIPNRTAMLCGAAVLAASAFAATAAPTFSWLLAHWFVIGASYSMAMTPSGRLLRRSAHPEDRPALFAAQFALSHACWLVTYPLAGWTGAALGLPATSIVLAVIAGAAVAAAASLWPASDPEAVEHSHNGLHASHPHWNESVAEGRNRHAHTYIIDDLHSAWPNAR